jgi:hypothetical protein
LSIFFKTIHKQTDQLLINSKKSLENMFNDVVKYDSRSTLSKNIFDFYRNYENYMTKTKNMMVKFEKDIIEPVSIFGKHLSGKYQDSLNEFKSVKIKLKI